MALIRAFYGPFEVISTGMIGFGGSESLFAYLKTEESVAAKYLARHFLGIWQSLERDELGNVYWLPGTENPAGGLTGVRGDLVPPIHLPGSGNFSPGVLRSPRAVSPWGGGIR